MKHFWYRRIFLMVNFPRDSKRELLNYFTVKAFQASGACAIKLQGEIYGNIL